MKGTVHTWNAERAFGYIKPDDSDFSDVYLGASEVTETRDRIGLRVEFEIAPPSFDKLGQKEGRARNVTVIGRSDVVVEQRAEVREPGLVIFVNDERGYGFMKSGKENVWFGTASMAGAKFKKGDIVEYIRTRTFREDKGPAAAKVFSVKGNQT